MPASRPLADRFWEKVHKTPTCWLWTGARIPQGYGSIGTKDGTQVGAHRVAYELLVGEIPAKAHLHHTCRVKHCVNPAHLQVMQPREHMIHEGSTPPAKNSAKTECPQHHPYDKQNTYVDPSGRRHCRACQKVAQAKWLSK